MLFLSASIGMNSGESVVSASTGDSVWLSQKDLPKRSAVCSKAVTVRSKVGIHCKSILPAAELALPGTI
jgi:hypothetical protein